MTPFLAHSWPMVPKKTLVSNKLKGFIASPFKLISATDLR